MNQMEMCAIGALCLGVLGATYSLFMRLKNLQKQLIRSSITVMDDDVSDVENLDMENVNTWKS